MDIYERLKELCQIKGIAISKMEEDLCIPKGNSNKWRTSRPRVETVMKLAEYFDVSPDYILTGEEPDSGYYADREANQIAEEILQHKELKALFDIVKDMPKDRIESLYNVLKKE